MGIPVELSTKIAEGVGIKWSSMLKHPKAKGKGWLIEKMLSVPSCTTPRPLPPASHRPSPPHTFATGPAKFAATIQILDVELAAGGVFDYACPVR